jgi:type VI secretion system protein ImpI
MSLILSVLHSPDTVPLETRQVEDTEFRIGRGSENNWVLADADRILSKRHCILAFRDGIWQIADLSTNGTFLNHEADPIGPAKPRRLRDGDRLRLGLYEIEVRIDSPGQLRLQPGQDRASAAASISSRTWPFDDPFAETPLGGHSAFAPDGLIAPAYQDDPLTADPREDVGSAPAAADHSPAYDDAFRPPPLAPKLLPEDWDLEFAANPPAKAEPPVPPTPSASAPALPLAPAGDDLFALFLQGAGMRPAQPEDAEATMRQLGAVFRATVTGLRQALIARAAIKGEFRIEQTMIRARGNNPLKFSADDDDALAALLGIGRHTDMAPDAAVAEALRDMRLHEVAVMAAMQSAIRAVLARLDPEAIRAEAEHSGRTMLPAQRKARAFDNFTALHAAMTQALADDFDSLFGKHFARAYEQALREAESRER